MAEMVFPKKEKVKMAEKRICLGMEVATNKDAKTI